MKTSCAFRYFCLLVLLGCNACRAWLRLLTVAAPSLRRFGIGSVDPNGGSGERGTDALKAQSILKDIIDSIARYTRNANPRQTQQPLEDFISNVNTSIRSIQETFPSLSANLGDRAMSKKSKIISDVIRCQLDTLKRNVTYSVFYNAAAREISQTDIKPHFPFDATSVSEEAMLSRDTTGLKSNLSYAYTLLVKTILNTIIRDAIIIEKFVMTWLRYYISVLVNKRTRETFLRLLFRPLMQPVNLIKFGRPFRRLLVKVSRWNMRAQRSIAKFIVRVTTRVTTLHHLLVLIKRLRMALFGWVIRFRREIVQQHEEVYGESWEPDVNNTSQKVSGRVEDRIRMPRGQKASSFQNLGSCIQRLDKLDQKAYRKKLSTLANTDTTDWISDDWYDELYDDTGNQDDDSNLSVKLDGEDPNYALLLHSCVLCAQAVYNLNLLPAATSSLGKGVLDPNTLKSITRSVEQLRDSLADIAGTGRVERSGIRLFTRDETRKDELTRSRLLGPDTISTIQSIVTLALGIPPSSRRIDLRKVSLKGRKLKTLKQKMMRRVSATLPSALSNIDNSRNGTGTEDSEDLDRRSADEEDGSTYEDRKKWTKGKKQSKDSTKKLRQKLFQSEGLNELIGKKMTEKLADNNVHILTIQSTRACVLLIHHAAEGLAIISFRGTKEINDVVSDLSFIPVRFDSLFTDAHEVATNRAPNRVGPTKYNFAEYTTIPYCHEGFLLAFESVKAEISDWVETLPKGTRLVFTGHSMGGALAQLAAAYFTMLSIHEHEHAKTLNTQKSSDTKGAEGTFRDDNADNNFVGIATGIVNFTPGIGNESSPVIQGKSTANAKEAIKSGNGNQSTEGTKSTSGSTKASVVGEKRNVWLVSLAAPAVGNRAFSSILQEGVNPSGGIRLWNELDVVPYLTLPLGFIHAGMTV